ncbi:hypothetical protein THRCLA_11521, partial [Thraustotheca clavata]
MTWSIAFMKDDCTCNASSLFNLKYLRTHRAGSIKFIRCFPHCCPEHSYNNFCTTSIGIRVSNVQERTRDEIAFLRFHTTAEVLLKQGQKIAQKYVLNDIRSLENPKGDWIPSHIGQYNPKLQELTFRFNHNNCVGWHYGWMGTSTKAHRTCSHYLVAYILRPDIANPSAFTVVAVQPSPPFIVMSYRRACFFCQKHKPSESKPARYYDSCHCEGEFNVTNGIISTASTPAPSQPQQAVVPVAAPRVATPVRVTVIECQLAILYYFMQELPGEIFTYEPLKTALKTSIFQSLIQRLGSQWHLELEEFGDLVDRGYPPFFRAQSNRANNASELLLEAGMEPVLLVCIDVLGSVLAFMLEANSSLFSSYTAVLFNRDQLFEAYTSWLNEIYAVVSARLGASFEATLSKVVLDIVQLSSKVPDLQPLQTKLHLLNTMDAQASIGFDYFVAQLREVYLADQHPIAFAITAPSPFCGRWLYHEVKSNSYNSESKTADPSLGSVIRMFLLGYAFDMNLQNTTLTVKSELCAYTTIPAIFELDDQGRVFRVLPHGESSMSQMSGLIHGDYVGSVVDDTLALRIYCWPFQTEDITVPKYAYILE